jgi:hypothetical protein
VSAFEGLRDRWDALSTRDRRALSIGLIALVPAVLIFGVINPYRATLEETRDRIASERALLERELGLLETGDEMPQALAAAAERADRTAERLIAAPNRVLAEAELTALIESLAGSSRVLLQELRGVSDTTWSGPSGIIPVRLAVRGESDLQGVAGFLRQIEASPTLVRIVEISVAPVPPAAAPAQGGRGGAQPRRQPADVIEFTALIEAYAAAYVDRSNPTERDL